MLRNFYLPTARFLPPRFHDLQQVYTIHFSAQLQDNPGPMRRCGSLLRVLPLQVNQGAVLRIRSAGWFPDHPGVRQNLGTRPTRRACTPRTPRSPPNLLLPPPYSIFFPLYAAMDICIPRPYDDIAPPSASAIKMMSSCALNINEPLILLA